MFVSSTESAKEILSNDLGKFTKKYIRSIGEVIGSESLLCASHKSHKLIRRHLLDLFTSRSNADFTKQFDELVVKSLSKWEYKENVVILDEALKVWSTSFSINKSFLCNNYYSSFRISILIFLNFGKI